MNHTITRVTLTFTVYGTPGLHNFVFFTFIFALYASILFVNLFLVLVICIEPNLHRPMYIILVNLAINGVIGSSSVCPKVMQYLLLETHESTLEACLTQVFFVNVYACCAYCILALMAYDRYVAICKPLQYHSIMTPNKVMLLLAVIYFFTGLFSAAQVYMTSRLQLCRHTVDKLICDNLSIYNLSCEKSLAIDALSLFVIMFLIFLPVVLVLLSYVHILLVCLKFSKESQKKALRTCTPHLVTFISFAIVSFFGVIFNRLSLNLPRAVNIFASISFFVMPPLLNPIIYGIKTREIWISIFKITRKRIIQF